MRFTKMQGCGNDYVYVDLFRERLTGDVAKLAVAVADRHFGVGGDGLILICPSERADARMRMFNADGSEAEMCGNGLRCVAKYVYDHGIARKERLTIETGRGILTVDLEVKGGKARRVRVDMGEPILEAAKIPTTLPANPPTDAELVVEGEAFAFTCVSMGNPHAVTFDDVGSQREELAPLVQTDVRFPHQVNVGFAKLLAPQQIELAVFERGAGWTRACGTGACAAAVAAVETGRARRRESIEVRLPGGALAIVVGGAGERLAMTGPARHVFDGTVEL
jgi:diaminopimelate epimerase